MSLFRLTYSIVAAICVISGAAPVSLAAPNAVSDLLPIETLKELEELRLWRPELDDPEHPEGAKLSDYIQSLQFGKEPPAQLVESVFMAVDSESSRLSPADYALRYWVLRGLADFPQASPRLREIRDVWKRKYLDIALTSMKLAHLPELEAMVDHARERILNGSLRVTDLSPRERNDLSQKIPEAHGISLSARDPATRKFRVTGLYHYNLSYMAVDFARPIEETLITLVHEIVHAADPGLEGHRETIRALSPRIIEILHRMAPDSNVLPVNFLALEGSVDFTEIKRFQRLTEEIRSKRLEQLSSKLQPSRSGDSLSPDDQIVLGRWMRAAIGLTVENEYRAYGFSYLTYSALRNRWNLLGPSAEALNFVEKLIAGDAAFATRLSVDKSPFPAIRHALVLSNLRQSSRTIAPQLERALEWLEYTYLTESEKFLRSLDDRFANSLKGLAQLPVEPFEEDRNPLPTWARPGGYDLPTHPRHILSVRITKASAVAYRSALAHILSDLRETNAALLAVSSGVLDLHDLSVGELKLIGALYSDSPLTRVPTLLPSHLKEDLNAIDPALPPRFPLVQFNPEQSPLDGAIDSSELLKNLTALRTLKADLWLERNFPPLRESFTGARAFIQRLRNRLSFNPDEMTVERAREIEDELLLPAVDDGGRIRAEMDHLQTLLSHLGELYQISYERQWQEISQRFMRRARFVTVALEDMGASGERSFEDGKRRIAAAGASIRKDVRKRLAWACEDNSQRGQLGFWKSFGPIEIHSSQFPVTVFCWKNDFYLARQPGDLGESVTSTMSEGRPELRVFKGARPIRLSPSFPIREKKR